MQDQTIRPTTNANIAAVVSRALATGIPKLQLLSETPHALTLCHTHTGQIISDNECETDFQALQPGIFMRVPAEQAGQRRFIWLFLCRADDLQDVLASLLQHVPPHERQAIAPDTVWQSYQWSQIKQARTRRS